MFLIIGTGGIGGYFGGLLANAGFDVTFLARGKHFDALKTSGLKLNTVDGPFDIKPLKVISDINKVKSPDVILFCVKTYDTVSLAIALKPVVNSDTLIISVQNGIENDIIIKNILGLQNVYPGLAHIISSVREPGVINQTGGPRTIIFGDRTSKKNLRLQEIAEMMTTAGIKATVSENIENSIWEKFIFIASFSGFTAICRCEIGKIINDEKLYELYQRAINESVNVAIAAGVDLPRDIFSKVVERTEKYRGKDEKATSSLMRDFLGKDMNEIDTLSGSIVRLGEELGIDVPIHKMIYYVIKATKISST